MVGNYVDLVLLLTMSDLLNQVHVGFCFNSLLCETEMDVNGGTSASDRLFLLVVLKFSNNLLWLAFFGLFKWKQIILSLGSFRWCWRNSLTCFIVFRCLMWDPGKDEFVPSAPWYQAGFFHLFFPSQLYPPVGEFLYIPFQCFIFCSMWHHLFLADLQRLLRAWNSLWRTSTRASWASMLVNYFSIESRYQCSLSMESGHRFLWDAHDNFVKMLVQIACQAVQNFSSSSCFIEKYNIMVIFCFIILLYLGCIYRLVLPEFICFSSIPLYYLNKALARSQQLIRFRASLGFLNT